ncbi:MAG: hypothetical protein J4431_01690 [Candidatus Aenigmarchaeota archaeon]|nr:hypothetical protein [Candidatus Aenigmarchaeota archaeon]
MKGQYRIIMEVLFFAIGILLASYMIISFSGVSDTVKGISTQNQLESVANSIKSAIAKSSELPNAAIRVRVPATISESSYYMRLESEAGGNCASSSDCYLNVTISSGEGIREKIFNIVGDIDIISGFATSGSEFAEIRKEGNGIRLSAG